MNPADSAKQLLGLPSFANLKKEYLDYVSYTRDQVLEKVGGKVKVNNFKNVCAVRLSRTLNYNSILLPSKNQSGAMDVVSGDDGKWYAYRVSELSKWLAETIGSPSFTKEKSEGTPFDKTLISQRSGIIEFKIKFRPNDGEPPESAPNGHFDLWNGQKFTSEEAGSADDYWSRATRISVWPC